ncbi:TonB-dependent receptor [Croceicoccus sediminis]|uniref:TonB-dependent receptor n=1 Tax=Croceicoccus sediminis TaxID=2571150 RepID=UPI00118383AE|nr:TonB-dependent receptor [Croceicoccus sediminis]
MKTSGSLYRAAWGVALPLSSLLAIAVAVPAQAKQQISASPNAEKAQRFDIRSNDLNTALTTFAKQAGIQLVVNVAEIKTLPANPVVGTFTRAEALRRLVGNQNVVTVWPSPDTLAVRAKRAAYVKASAQPTPAPAPLPALKADEAETKPAAWEIVVTAQKREQNLQDVPVSITAVTSDALVSGGITTTADLSAAVPGLNVTRQLSSIAPIIRGVGNYNSAPGAEGAVAVYVDGVYQPDAHGAVLALANIDRIEVLRGPQGTLFGRNATGGLIHVITRTPSFTPTGDFSVSYGNKETVELKGYLSGPLSDTIAIDFAGLLREQGKGFGTNLVTGEDATYRNERVVRTKILVEPSSDLSLTLSADYAKTDTDLGSNLRIPEGSTTSFGTPPPENFWSINQAQSHPSSNEQWGGYARAELDLGGVDLMGLVSYRENRTFASNDQISDPIPFINIDLPLESDTFTAELQLTSAQGGFLEWIGGLYYMDNRAGVYPFAIGGPGVPVLPAPGGPYSSIDRTNEQNTKSYSVFGEAVLNFTDSTNLTVGARLTRDERTFTGSQVLTTVGGTVITPPVVELSAKYTEPTYRAVLNQRLNDDIMVYGSYSRGFKSGIFGVFTVAGDPVDPETLDSFEVGFKSEFGYSFRLNGAAFYYNYSDLQLTSQTDGKAILRNAAKARSKGFELEANWYPTDILSFDASFSYVDAKFRDFPGAELTAPNPNFTGTPPPFVNTSTFGNAAGNRLPRAPEFTFSVGGRADVPTSFGKVGGAANVYYNDGFYNEFANRFRQDSYTLVNASAYVAIGEDEKYRITVFGRNIFNTEYYSYGVANVFGDFIAPAFGAEYGVRVGVSF